ncbi:uncharacterized protein LOC105217414 [Zeugodacus cucurbitae]|uniref:uncharacterized protein LOC105217414 n=1 Tax=Zeugodacus cucurbitae TaxID=28588 RepID=UPI0005969367|nr:uncharacterized protein LOC105217414 [Zeugodacus cucurbitae]
MNPDNKLGGNDGGICCSPACPPRERQPIPSIGKPYEAPCTSTCLCTPKMCSIFGGHDYNAPGPDPKACSPRKSKAINVNTLGAPIGVLQATIATKSSTPDVHPHRFATTIVAFMKVYTTPESQWTEETLDGLLKEGQVLLAKPADPEYNVDSPLHIYSPLEAKVKRWHKVDDVAFQVELGEKYYFSPPVGPEEGPPPDLTMDKFRVAMKKFFSKHRFCLIKVAGTYKMVWRSRGVYFVLDLYGRKPEDLETDKENGRAMLICLKALDNVIHLINNLSGIQPTDPFNLRELKVVKMTGTDGKTMSRDFGKREHQYQVISDEYAVLKGDTHLLRNSPDPIRTRSALPVGVAALLAAKIDHPATWNERMIEKIICYGVNVCVCCWEQCVKAKEPIDIERFPNRLKIAQFKARYTLTPRKFTGIWKCVPNFKQTELEAALISSFDVGDNNLLVQIDQNIYAVFKKNNFFYLFDPYRHRIEGLPAPEGEDKKEVEVHRNATLRMFRSLEMLLKVFTQMLLETNRTTQFAVHTLKINNIEFSANEAIGAPEEPILNEDIDVKSLNETLCFEEDETKCKLDLGGDDEDEDDITSGIVQMEMPERSETEESEEELEEEEGGLEDLGEYESSSSGDGHRHGKGRRKKSKGRKRKDGDGGGKGKKKGGKGKGKKGKAKGEKTDKLKKDKNKRKSEKGKKGKKDKDKENKDKKKKDKDDSDKRKSEKDKRKSDKDKSDKEKAEQDRKDKEKADKDKADKDKEDKDKDKTDKDKDKDTDKDKEPEKRTVSQMQRADIVRKGEDDGRKQVDSSRVGGDQDGRDGRDGKDDRGGRDGRDIRSRDDRSAYDSSCGDERRDGDDYPPLMCKPNSYPGYSCVAYDMAVVGSESGTYESICKLLRAGFKCADRILTMTPWGNYVVFRGRACYDQIYFLFDGCTCNVNRFRHLDLNCGTAGLICFENMHDIICYILDSQKIRSNLKKSRKKLVDEICRQYC